MNGSAVDNPTASMPGRALHPRQSLPQRLGEAPGVLSSGLELPGQNQPVQVRMIDLGRQHVAGVIARIDGHEPHEAAQQQACPDEQHQGQRHLRHRQRSPGPVR